MLRYELLTGFRSAVSASRLRTVGHSLTRRPGRPEATPAVVPPDPRALDDDAGDSAERARLLRKACAHGQVAIQVSEIMQGNVTKREDLQHLLTGLRWASGKAADISAAGHAVASASLRDEIGMLDRIIAWQLTTISWHRAEDRRLRDQASHGGAR